MYDLISTADFLNEEQKETNKQIQVTQFPINYIESIIECQQHQSGFALSSLSYLINPFLSALR